MNFLGATSSDLIEPIPGQEYLTKLHKYLKTNLPRLSPQSKGPTPPTVWQQSYTLLTLGLDPSSQPLSRNVKAPLTLGFGQPSTPSKRPPPKPLQLRLPPDRLLYLLLRWQSLSQGLSHVGRTDVPIEEGVPVAARGARIDGRENVSDGDVQSVRSWVGSMRSVSMGSLATGVSKGGMGWFGKKEELNEDKLLLELYSIFTVLPALLIHPPFSSDRPIAELNDAGGYTQLGGIDVRVPLDVLRNLQTLELEGYDPRGLLIPPNPGLRSLTIRDVQDADDWLDELISLDSDPIASPDPASNTSTSNPSPPPSQPRFPNLRHLCLYSTTLLAFPTLPLSHLTSLDLSQNLLNGIPSSLSSLPSLTSLNLSNNLVTSVRNAPQVLVNITSLNLSRNRIDCLVGLERVLGLERIDVRHNDLPESSEVGRLAVLPMINEVWAAGNPFDEIGNGGSTREDWRVELGVAFQSERRYREVILDDQPFTWSENRRIESILTSRGLTHGSTAHSRGSSTPAQTPRTGISRTQTPSLHPHPSPAPAPHTQTHAHAHASTSTSTPTPTPSSAVSAPSLAVQQKKRRPRRVIELDDTGISKGDDGIRGGSMRLPSKTGETDRGVGSATVGFGQGRGKGERGRLEGPFEPPGGGGSGG